MTNKSRYTLKQQDPNTAVAVWESMAQKDRFAGTAGEVVSLFSTHPSSESRHRKLNEVSRLLETQFDARCKSVKEDFQALVKKTMKDMPETYIV